MLISWVSQNDNYTLWTWWIWWPQTRAKKKRDEKYNVYPPTLLMQYQPRLQFTVTPTVITMFSCWGFLMNQNGWNNFAKAAFFLQKYSNFDEHLTRELCPNLSGYASTDGYCEYVRYKNANMQIGLLRFQKPSYNATQTALRPRHSYDHLNTALNE